jgi:xanthine dehydrogenase YagS FAD-binding subunit
MSLTYVKANSTSAAGDAGRAAGAAFIAGGTTLVDLLRLGVEAPEVLVDIQGLEHAAIDDRADGLYIGALVSNTALAYAPAVSEGFPVLSEALLSGASPQLRNMATVGGNVLQRTRCSYFRDSAVDACNKRKPGSGCAARGGYTRMHAILGGSEQCIAVHPSDMCVALVALDAVVHTAGAHGERSIPIADFHTLPLEHPEIESVLEHGELITHVVVPRTAFAKHSSYVKARDRASYAFALASAAAALELDNGVVKDARIALGGVATKPWRTREVEAALRGQPATRESFVKAAAEAVRGAQPLADNGFKVELVQRCIVRALENARDRT